jgi:hypothetical protein
VNHISGVCLPLCDYLCQSLMNHISGVCLPFSLKLCMLAFLLPAGESHIVKTFCNKNFQKELTHECIPKIIVFSPFFNILRKKDNNSLICYSPSMQRFLHACFFITSRRITYCKDILIEQFLKELLSFFYLYFIKIVCSCKSTYLNCTIMML